MKILFVITRGDLVGGAQIHVRDMSIALKKKGFQPRVLVGSRGDFTAQLSNSEIEWELIPELKRNISPIHDIAAITHIRQSIKQFKPDLISTHTAKAGMVGRIAAILEKYPVIFTAHGWQFADGIPAKQALPVLWIERILSRHTARIITVSEYDHKLALRKKASASEKLITIHNGLPDTAKHEKRSDKIKSDTAKMVMIARFQPQKDHKTLLKALKKIETLDWEMRFVSDGPEMESVRGIAKEKGLSGKVRFLGQRSDVEEILKDSDIFVLVSHWEGFPRSIVEAMRESLPVVCTDVGGCGESVVHEETGLLVKEGDEEGLADALKLLLTQKETALRMGNEGRRRYEENFTFEIMFEKTVSVYSEVSRR